MSCSAVCCSSRTTKGGVKDPDLSFHSYANKTNQNMNIPFPVLTPRLIDPKWFNADSPCDEDAELTALEQANQQRLNAITEQYMKRAPLGKTEPEPMEEEADTDEEEGNDESDESEESHDEDEEEDVPTSYSPSRNNNELEPDSLDDLNESQDLNASDQSALWTIQ